MLDAMKPPRYVDQMARLARSVRRIGNVFHPILIQIRHSAWPVHASNVTPRIRAGATQTDRFATPVTVRAVPVKTMQSALGALVQAQSVHRRAYVLSVTPCRVSAVTTREPRIVMVRPSVVGLAELMRSALLKNKAVESAMSAPVSV